MSAYRYTTAGRPVYVLGRAGRWFYAVDALPKVGDQLGTRYPTRAAAIHAAGLELAAAAHMARREQVTQ